MKLLKITPVRYGRFKVILFFSLVFSLPIIGISQEEILEELVISQEEKGPESSDEKEVFIDKGPDKVPYFFRHHKKIPISYSGFAIELTTADLPLKRDYFLFEKFGNVFYEKRKEGGYAYLILIDFKSKKAVEDFLNNIVLPKAPEAKMVNYKRGVRKTK